MLLAVVNLPTPPAGGYRNIIEKMAQELFLGKGKQQITFAHATLAWDVEVSAELALLLVNSEHLQEAVHEKIQVLILVNGYQRARSDFRAFRKRIAQTNPFVVTVAFDNRGSGETLLLSNNSGGNLKGYDGPRGDQLLTQMALDGALLASAVCHKLSVNQFAALGISMGGMICQRLAGLLEGPIKNDFCTLSKLILASTTAGGRLRVWPNQSENQTFKEWPTVEAELFTRMSKYFAARFLQKSPMLVELMVKNMLRSHAAAGEQVSLASRLQFEASANFDAAGDLPKILCETLIISGDEDAVIPLGNAHLLQGALKQANLKIYLQTGHLILVEEPEKFVYDVAEFLVSKQ